MSEYIWLRKSLREHPKVTELAKILGYNYNTKATKMAVAGSLYIFCGGWAQISRKKTIHTTEAKAEEILARFDAEMPGFCDALKRVGWLTQNGGTISIRKCDQVRFTDPEGGE